MEADRERGASDGPWVRRIVLSGSALFLGLFVVAPLGQIAWGALEGGAEAWVTAFGEDGRAAALLTLMALLASLPINITFGLAAAWALARRRFRGRELLLALIDLPFTVSPVVSGLVFVLLFGAQSSLGRWLVEHDTPIVFATPGIVLATVFVTFPLVARELIPLLEELGDEEDLAALSLGATPWTMFWRVTLPNLRWGLLYGVTLSAARALGEFGAVSVVSGHIRGRTNTLPLHIEALYNEYNLAAAFAAAATLGAAALVGLVLRRAVAKRLAAQAHED